MLPKHISKAVISFYNHLTDEGVESVFDIPTNRLKVILLYSDQELYRPEIIRMLKRGLSWRDICRILGVKYNTVRTEAKRLK